MAFVIERLGKYKTTLKSGLHFLIPIVDRISFFHSLKEEVFNIPDQIAVTPKTMLGFRSTGLFTLRLKTHTWPLMEPSVLLMRLFRLLRVSCVLRLGNLLLTMHSRENINDEIVRGVNEAATAYGLKCIRCVIKDINPPQTVRQAMELQADAERKKRVKILVSEGERDAAINQAEGERRAAFLAAEGELAKADASSKGIALVSKSLMGAGGVEAAGLKVAEQYVAAFGNVAKQSTTLLLLNDATGLSAQISQAMLLYKRLGGNPTTGSTGSFEAGTPSETPQHATKAIKDEPVSEEMAASKFSLQNQPGFSLQNNK